MSSPFFNDLIQSFVKLFVSTTLGGRHACNQTWLLDQRLLHRWLLVCEGWHGPHAFSEARCHVLVILRTATTTIIIVIDPMQHHQLALSELLCLLQWCLKVKLISRFLQLSGYLLFPQFFQSFLELNDDWLKLPFHSAIVFDLFMKFGSEVFSVDVEIGELLLLVLKVGRKLSFGNG